MPVMPQSSYSLKEQIAAKKMAPAPALKSDVEFSAGDRVKHNVFGEGTVISAKKISNDCMLEVAFDKVGTKKLMANFAKILKI